MLMQLRFVTSESAFNYFRATRAYLAWRAAILKPGVLRAVDLHQFAQAIAPPARVMR